jgi:pimeloyl-ACP methyl ester carboxylesterase
MVTESRDWLSGAPLDLRGRKKVVRAAGVLSRSGDATQQLAGFARLLQREQGFAAGDFLEVTYHGRTSTSGWSPLLYGPDDVDVPLRQSVEQVRRHLAWYDAALPPDLELHLVGYSLGGVVLFRAAGELLATEPGHWAQRLGSVITISSPHFGCDLGIEGDLLGLFGFHSLVLPGERISRELCELGSNPRHRAEVEQMAERLRQAGVRLLTLADGNDVVVTAADAVIAPAAQRARLVLNTSRARVGGAYADNPLGHGPLLDNPKAWQLMAETIGPQQLRGRTESGAIAL